MRGLKLTPISVNIEPKSNGESQSNTEAKLRSRANLKPFGPGPDPRRNLNGRPKSFDALRALTQKLAREKVGNGEIALTRLLREWRDGDEALLQKAFVEIGFGKVPDKVEMSGPDGKSLKPMVIQVITQTNVPQDERVN